MLQTVKDTCQIHPMALDYAMGEQIENLADVIDRTAGEAREFFEKNYTSFRTVYSFAFLYEKEEELCSVQCDYVTISLTYDNATQSFLLTRSFQIYGS